MYKVKLAKAGPTKQWGHARAFRSWVNTTENHHENRMHVIYFDGKHQLRHFLALFSRSRTLHNLTFAFNPRSELRCIDIN